MKRQRPTLAARLVTRIEQAGGTVQEPRDLYRLERTYAGPYQQASGACTWTLKHPEQPLTYMGSVPARDVVRGPVSLYGPRIGAGRDVWVDPAR